MQSSEKGLVISFDQTDASQRPGSFLAGPKPNPQPLSSRTVPKASPSTTVIPSRPQAKPRASEGSAFRPQGPWQICRRFPSESRISKYSVSPPSSMVPTSMPRLLSCWCAFFSLLQKIVETTGELRSNPACSTSTRALSRIAGSSLSGNLSATSEGSGLSQSEGTGTALPRLDGCIRPLWPRHRAPDTARPPRTAALLVHTARREPHPSSVFGPPTNFPTTRRIQRIRKKSAVAPTVIAGAGTHLVVQGTNRITGT